LPSTRPPPEDARTLSSESARAITPTHSSSRLSRLSVLAVAALLALHYLLAVGSKRHESITSDEIAHVVSGTTFWQLNDYRFQPENGNLPQRIEGLPAALMGTKDAPLKGNVYWQFSDIWAFGHEMMYETGDDHFPRLMAARLLIAFFSVAVGLLIFLWSRRLFGTCGGFLSLLLYAFYPSYLAHGALATSDICVVFFFIAFLGAWWRALNGGSGRTLALSILLFGLAFVAKYSALLLLPVVAFLLALRALKPEPLPLLGRRWEGLGQKLLGGSLAIALHLLSAFVIIWASFGFRYSGFNPSLPPGAQYIDSFPILCQTNGFQGHALQKMADVHLLPEAYLYGYAYVLETTKARAAFLDGEYSTEGWHAFFLKAFAYKSTLPFIALLFVAALAVLFRWRARPGRWKEDLYRTAPLSLFCLLYWAGALTSHLNIGERHLLPAYAEMIIFAGAAGTLVAARTRLAGLLVAGLALWHALEAVSIYPHYLAYFNEAAGGPANGWRHMADSSLDWGQDLPGLADWLKENTTAADKVYLSYFGTAEPDYYHIRAQRLDFVNGFHLKQPVARLEGGVYCIGATMLDQVYGQVRGPWTIEQEKDYQSLRSLLPSLTAPQGSSPRPDLKGLVSTLDQEKAIRRFVSLETARMCYYLRVRKPDAMIGYSIMIYRLTPKEVHDAAQGSLKEWSEAILAAAAPP
jgi:hypothetical protein